MIGESFENMGPIETIAAKVVRCELCKAEYPENYIELHLFGIHGVSGPKEFYTNQKIQQSKLRKLRDFNVLKSVERQP